MSQQGLLYKILCGIQDLRYDFLKHCVFLHSFLIYETLRTLVSSMTSDLTCTSLQERQGGQYKPGVRK